MVWWPRSGRPGSNGHTEAEKAVGTRELEQVGAFLRPREAGPSVWGQSLQRRLHPHLAMALCFYGSQGFPLKCSGLLISSLPPPQAISLQLTSVFSLGLLSKPHVPAPSPYVC